MKKKNIREEKFELDGKYYVECNNCHSNITEDISRLINNILDEIEVEVNEKGADVVAPDRKPPFRIDYIDTRIINTKIKQIRQTLE